MAVNRPCYASRDEVMRALDVSDSASRARQVDRAISAASDLIDGDLNRIFYPVTATRYKDFPNWQYTYPWRLWLDADEVVSVSTLTAGGTVISPSNYNLEPANLGPPYDRIELNRSSTATFAPSTTPQRAISIAGVFGFGADKDPAGTLAAAMTDTVGTTATVSDSSAIGVGDVLYADTEKMLVTGKTQVTTGQTLQAPSLTASQANNAVGVTTGSAYAEGEVILIDTEQMLITAIAGNVLTVKRAFSGTVLAAHTNGATIFAPRQLTVTRGALGSTAATHSNSAPLSIHRVPPGIKELAIAESLNTLASESSAWARTVGEGDNVRNATGAGLASLRNQAMTVYGRQLRLRAV